jgi:penicillin-binding protein 1B
MAAKPQKKPPSRAAGSRKKAGSRAKARVKSKARRRRSRGGRLARWALVLALAAAAGLAGYGWWLSHQLQERFAGLSWSLPSRVYSDVMFLYSGLELDRGQLLAQLSDRGYRRVAAPPGRPGQYRPVEGGAELHLEGAGRLRITTGAQGLRLRPAGGGPEPELVELQPVELGQYFGPERESRRLVRLQNLPPHLVQAVLAAEDRSFRVHPGLDPVGILRALWVNLRRGEVVQGGSTITQQLAKSYFLEPERTLARKLKEAFLALVLEATFGKDQILEMYLNEIYLGQRGSAAVAGVGEAALFYFGRPAGELSLEQAALLAGLIRAPNRLSPHRHPQRARARRDQVLAAMAEEGWISRERARKAGREPLRVADYQAYHRRAPYFLDFVFAQLARLYPPEELRRLGLAIHTTLDWGVQRAAEQALAQGLARLEKDHPRLAGADSPLQGAVVVLEPATGRVLAMVGGRSYGRSQFNRAARARRQPGSTFKPFVYLAGLEELSPAEPLSNRPRTYRVAGRAWRPQNYAPHPAGEVRMREALSHSLNLPTVDLALKVGLTQVAATARGLGLELTGRPTPAWALGAMEVTPLELARAYCPLAADGVLPRALAVGRVQGPQGEELMRRHVAKRQVTTPAKAYIISSFLRSAVEEGTARSLRRRGVRGPVAAKTGTTDGFRDAWFVGYTPGMVALVWVGFDQGGSVGASGAGAALPIWAGLAKAAPWRLAGAWPPPPPGVVELTLCRESGRPAGPACPRVFRELFLDHRRPTGSCPLHQPDRDPAGDILRGIGDALREIFR